MRRNRREHIAAAATAGALAQAREIGYRNGRMAEALGNTSDDTSLLACADMWQQGCTWTGPRASAKLIDDALCCPRCGGIL